MYRLAERVSGPAISDAVTTTLSAHDPRSECDSGRECARSP